MANQPNWAQLARYVAGRCPPSEEREVDAWIRADPSRKHLIDQLRRIWEAAADDPPPSSDRQLDMDAEWKDMQDKMRAADASAPDRAPRDPARPERPQSRSRSERRTRRWGRLKWGVHAVAALLLLLGGLWLFPFGAEGPADAPAPAYRDVVTEPGERSRIQMTDGSSAMLNVDSKLRLPRTFGNGRRVVRLTGEAYFEVEPDPDRPFIVKTNDASVRVHGTSFNVRGYPEDETVQVAVTEGDVSVHPKRSGTPDDRGVPLRSGEVGWLLRADTTVTTKTADVTPYIGWTEGRLVFENSPLSEVALRLERWYNMDVTTRSAALDSLRLTANLKSQSVRNVLDVISATLGIQYRIKQNTIVLLPHDSSR